MAVSFEFLILEYDRNGYVTKCSNDHKFENCGVQMLYMQVAMEFDIDSNPYPFQEIDDDVSVDTFNGAGNGNVDSDTDESSPKRFKVDNMAEPSSTVDSDLSRSSPCVDTISFSFTSS